MSRATVFTDGAAKGNPGPGGWGAIVVTADARVAELGGESPHTTNNKMELSGAIAALEAIADVVGPVTIYTDSTYLIQGITQWVWAWRKRGWRTATGSDVLNRDLWSGCRRSSARAASTGGGSADTSAPPATNDATRSPSPSRCSVSRPCIAVHSRAMRSTC
jgi:ribonuclease HI